MNSLFAYGTLMRGECRHHLLAPARPLRVLRATARGRLYDLGSYPALLVGEGRVHGEYMEFESLEALLPVLDEIEGSEYRRDRIAVDVETLGAREAWAYVWSVGAPRGRLIESGAWRKRE